MSDQGEVKDSLHEAVNGLEGDEAVTLIAIQKTGVACYSNTSATGLQSTIDVLMSRLGYLLAEAHGSPTPRDEVEAYCLGAKAVANAASEKVEALRTRHQNGSRQGTHTVEDVTDGAGAADSGKVTH